MLMIIVKIGDKKYFSSEVPIAIIFENDVQRLKMANHLLSMEPKDNAERWIAEYPQFKTEQERRVFMELGDGEESNPKPVEPNDTDGYNVREDGSLYYKQKPIEIIEPPK
jgi:hypothetical protein